MSLRPAYFRVFLTFARNSLVRDMTFRGNFLIETVSSMAWMLINLALLRADLPATRRRSARHRLGQVSVLHVPRHRAVDQQPGADALHDQRRRVERTDPHRRAGLRPAEADRHPVPHLAAADRLVVAGQFLLRAGAAGAMRWCSCDYLPGAGADCALPAVRRSAAWRSTTA